MLPCQGNVIMTGAAGDWRLPLHRHHGAAGPGVRLLAGQLPRPLSGVRVATAANTLYMLGGQIVSSWRPCTNLRFQGRGADSSHEYYAEILRFQPDTEEWVLAGSMLQQRYDHASATIHFEDVRDVCFQ